MSTNYGQHITSRTSTPQSQPIPGREQEMAKNSAGGYTFTLDNWARLERFLILGAEGGTYYAGERELVRANAKAAEACLNEDGRRFVDTVVAVSTSGRAPKNDPAIFLLAMASQCGDAETRRYAHKALPTVCRIGTHLFQYTRDLKAFGSLNHRRTYRALVDWYAGKTVEQLAFQVAKYQSREKWSHRDLLRYCHPKRTMRRADFERLQPVLRWIVKNETEHLEAEGPTRLLWAFEKAKTASPTELVELITKYRLPWELVPTQHLKSPEVWSAILPGMAPHALVRNLGRLTSLGVLAPLSKGLEVVYDKLSDKEAIRKARLHPMKTLLAMAAYKQGVAGHAHRGKAAMTWQVLPQVLDALDKAFYLGFEAVEPTNKRWLLALDISGSMGGQQVAGTRLTAREVAAAFAMVVCRTEPKYAIVGFAHGPGAWLKPNNARQVHGHGAQSIWGGSVRDGIMPLSISPRQRLDDVVQYTASLPMGGTDCALPMLFARHQNVDADAIVIITDNETWAGDVQPTQALKQYRDSAPQRRGTKLAVLGVTATEFTIADPTDPGQMDFVGFDANVPALLADFVTGESKRVTADLDD